MFATQDVLRFHGNENQLLGGFIVKQDKIQNCCSRLRSFFGRNLIVRVETVAGIGLDFLFVQRGFLDEMRTTEFETSDVIDFWRWACERRRCRSRSGTCGDLFLG